MGLLYTLFTQAFLLLPSLAIDLPALPANIEVDFVFPRNDTYASVDNFPIIFAIQNAALAWDFGFFVTWQVKNITPGASLTFVDSDTVVQSNIPKTAALVDPYFIVNYTTRLGGPYRDGTGTYRLSWDFALSQNCTESGEYINHTFGAGLAHGDLVFTIADGGKVIDFTDGGPCPIAGGVVGIQSNISGCAHVDSSGVRADPCNVNIDSSLASSFSAQLPVITASTSSSTTSKPTTAASGTTSATGTKTSLSTTPSATGNVASSNGYSQAVAAILAGVAGLCAVIV